MNRNPNHARYFTLQAALALRESYKHCGTHLDYGAIELEVDNIKTAYEALGRALDALGVTRLKPEHCKHPEDLRQRIDSSTDRCGACGMLYAMYAGKSSVYRKWLPGDQGALAQRGSDLTSALLAAEREKIVPGASSE